MVSAVGGGVAAVADSVFGFGGELGHRAVVAGGHEVGVVAEAARAGGGETDGAFAAALFGVDGVAERAA